MTTIPNIADGVTETQWAAKIVYHDGTAKHSPAAERDHAEFEVESINVYLDSLNEPTRRANGVDNAVLASRQVTTWPDGSTYSTAWAEVS